MDSDDQPRPGMLGPARQPAAMISEDASTCLRIDVITIFPRYLEPLGMSLIGKARARGALDVRLHDLREYAQDPHGSVDGTPYGGGPGMVMRPGPWGEALDAVVPEGTSASPLLIVPTPGGVPFTQRTAAAYAREPWLIFGCGRYEGIDARVLDEARTRTRVEEVSIGDYVLAGGEAAVLVIVEAVARLLPGVVGNSLSTEDDSFAAGSMEGLLEGPAYTRPASWRGRAVPPVLLSGDHGAVRRWRRDEALRRTARRRPELVERLDPARLDERDRAVLREARFPSSGEDVAE